MANRLEGVSKLAEQLLALGKLENGAALRTACRNGMKPVLEQAKATIPVGSEPHRLAATYGSRLVNAGFAKSMLALATKRFDGQRASAFVTVRKWAFYAVKFVEFGTRYQAPQPRIRNALYTKRAAVEEAFKASMQKSVDRAVKGQK